MAGAIDPDIVLAAGAIGAIRTTGALGGLSAVDGEGCGEQQDED